MSNGKERLLLIGAGGLGRQISEQVRLDYDCAFLDDDASLQGKTTCGIPVIETIANGLEKLCADYGRALITIGDNKTREQLFLKLKALGYKMPSVIYPTAYISPYATVGQGCIIMQNALVQNGSSVGDGTVIHPGAEIHHDAIVGDFSMVYTNSCIRTQAKLGQRCWIDSTVTVASYQELTDDAVLKLYRAM